MQKEIQRKGRCLACTLYLGCHRKEASGILQGENGGISGSKVVV